MRSVNIRPEERELPSSFSERLGKSYAEQSSSKDKKNKGQFFTPSSIAGFMGQLGRSRNGTISILDPGCGCAILSISLIEHLVSVGQIDEILLDAYETDSEVIPFTEAAISYLKEWLEKKNVAFSFNIKQDDFVLTNAEILNAEPNIFGSASSSKYDFIISNPPYFKLAKSDSRVKVVGNLVDGQTNIYALFMSLSACMLNEGGQMIFITPRSFASGRYFQSFRNHFFSKVAIDFIHLFNTRSGTFAKDDVLQELLILSCHPIGDNEKGIITISFSEGSYDLEKSYTKEYPSSDIVDVKSMEKIVYLPVCSKDEAVLNLFKSWDGNMAKYNIKISTGPVVAFRSTEYLQPEEGEDTVPLYWLHNVVKMLADHPVQKKDKCQYIRVADGSKSSLLPNKNYILLRRFSSKDDNSRLVAAPYFGNSSKYKLIGFENKLNYIYRPKGHMTRSEVMGIAALLNSELFDTYFRTFNGNVNVSATELRMMPFPPIHTIREIGNKIILKNDYSIEYVNTVIQEYFNI